MIKPTLGILICTIEGREKQLESLQYGIAMQMKRYNLKWGKDIIVQAYKDKKGEHTIGEKRNDLQQNCDALWSRFVDDDDKFSDNYLHKEVHLLNTENPDCINLKGIMFTNGINPEAFEHDLKYKSYETINGIYVRPPNHLNAIRTKIAKQFKFNEINHGEDTQWAMDICNAGALKTQSYNDEIGYYYQYTPNK
jgi:hypothetical protein